MVCTGSLRVLIARNKCCWRRCGGCSAIDPSISTKRARLPVVRVVFEGLADPHICGRGGRRSGRPRVYRQSVRWGCRCRGGRSSLVARQLSRRLAVTAAVRTAMVVAPIVGAPVVTTVVSGVVGAVVVAAVVAVRVEFDVTLVMSSAVRAHALLPLPISVATVVELAECRVQDARGVEEGLCVGPVSYTHLTLPTKA